MCMSSSRKEIHHSTQLIESIFLIGKYVLGSNNAFMCAAFVSFKVTSRQAKKTQWWRSERKKKKRKKHILINSLDSPRGRYDTKRACSSKRLVRGCAVCVTQSIKNGASLKNKICGEPQTCGCGLWKQTKRRLTLQWSQFYTFWFQCLRCKKLTLLLSNKQNKSYFCKQKIKERASFRLKKVLCLVYSLATKHHILLIKKDALTIH